MKRKILSILLSGLMVLSVAACNTGKTPTDPVTDPGNTEAEPVVVDEPATTGTGDWTLPEVNWGPGLFNGKTLIDDHFEDGEDFLWGTYSNGGLFELYTENGEMVVDISKTGTLDYSTQVSRDDFELNQGGVYECSFTIRSDIDRAFEWRFQINGGDYHAYYKEYAVEIGPEPQRISATFTMEEENDDMPRFCFNLGRFDGMDNTSHKVYIDDFNLTLVDASNAKAPKEEEKPMALKINQVGYKPGDKKKVVATTSEKVTAFSICDAETGEVVYEGTFADERVISKNGDGDTYTGDFSDFTAAGKYYVSVDGLDNSYSFEINDNVFDDVAKATVRMLYLQRCGCETTKELADVFAHPECHNTEAKIYGTNDYIDVTGGWHDAGDYGRYVVAGAKTIADLFMTYEDSSASRGDNYDIPESGNGVPDILDEARYELEWMLKMQAENGGVYHKVTCEQFPDVVMPQNEKEELVVCPISTTATGDFAAVMAKAGKIYRKYDAAFASKCSEAAKKAYAYMEENAENDKTGFINPEGVVTGEYPDGDNTDEFVWAAVELYLTTNDQAYLTKIRELTDKTFKGGLGWADMGTYAMYDFLKAKGYMETPVEFNLPADDNRSIQEIYASMSDVDYVRMKFSEKIKLFAETALENSTTDPYFSSLRIYPWGSNMTIANNGILYRMMYNMTGDETYNEYARYQIDYLLGVNAVAYSYVTGYGEHAAEHPHHRPSQAIGKAMPGMLVGGPNSNPADPYAIKVLSKKVGGSCYCDNDSAYSINEITIYWNSPLIYLLQVYK